MPGRRWVIATLLAVLGIAALTTACDASDGASNRAVDLLPASQHSRAWTWNAACPVGPVAKSGCAAAGPNLGPGQLTGDQWNLGAAAGSTGALHMALDSVGRLQIRADLSAAPPCTASTCVAPQANTWVRGYPSVLFGIDECHGNTAPPRSHALSLPMRLGALPSGVIGDTTYDAETASVTDDVAYDIWLNPSNTTSPCRTDGTLEVMVWTRYDAQALLPDSMKVGTVTVPYEANGSTQAGTDAWSVYVSNIFQNGHTQPWGGVVWLVVDSVHAVDRGNFKVDLTRALDDVADLLQTHYAWSNVRNRYYLDTLQFGVEYGGLDADLYGSPPAKFSLNLSSYCLHLATTVANAGKC